MNNKSENSMEILQGIIIIIVLILVFIYSKGFFDSSIDKVVKRHKTAIGSKIDVAKFKKELQENRTEIQFQNFANKYRGQLISWNVKVKEVKKLRGFYVISLQNSIFISPNSIVGVIREGVQSIIDSSHLDNNMNSICGKIDLYTKNSAEESRVLSLNPGDAIHIEAFIEDISRSGCVELVDGLFSLQKNDPTIKSSNESKNNSSAYDGVGRSMKNGFDPNRFSPKLNSYLIQNEIFTSYTDINFFVNEDLNGDGIDDYVYEINNSFNCGAGGCSTSIIFSSKSGYISVFEGIGLGRQLKVIEGEEKYLELTGYGEWCKRVVETPCKLRLRLINGKLVPN